MSVVAPIVFGGLFFVLGLLYSLLVLFFVLQSYDLDKEERAVCFTLVVVLPLCVGLCLLCLNVITLWYHGLYCDR